MQALYELGYTILSTNTYKGMIEAHKAMPDVMYIQTLPPCKDADTNEPPPTVPRSGLKTSIH